MTWTKTSDDFPETMFELSDAAYRLHHATTTFANRLLLDGRILKAKIGLVAVPVRVKRPAVIGELVLAGFWADDGDAWVLNDFFDAQPTQEEVLAGRAYDAVRQRLRIARAAERRGSPGVQTVRELELLEQQAKAGLRFSRERHRAGFSRAVSQRESRDPRPAPPRPVPTGTEDVVVQFGPQIDRLVGRAHSAVQPGPEEATLVRQIRGEQSRGASLKAIVEGLGQLDEPTRAALGAATGRRR